MKAEKVTSTQETRRREEKRGGKFNNDVYKNSCKVGEERRGKVRQNEFGENEFQEGGENEISFSCIFIILTLKMDDKEQDYDEGKTVFMAY